MIRTALRRVPGAARLANLTRERRALSRLLDTGRFDVDWYRLQAGADAGADARSAARHYLRRGRRAGLSPHPLFEPQWYDPTGWRDRPDDPFTAYLSRAAALREVSPHPLLDPGAVLAAEPQAARHRHGPFGYVVDDADGALLTAIPGRAGVDGASARRRLEAATRDWLVQEGLRRAPRRVRSLDHLGVRSWSEATARHPLPDPPAGGLPLVSVVMPVHGRSGLLRRAVDSVKAQTMPDWELVVVDDGSDDDTPAVLESLAAADPRIRVLTQPPSGVSRARNRALAAARGRYVAFLDSDNTWVRQFLDLALRAMAGQDLQVAHAVLELHRGRDVTYRAFEGDRAHLLLGNHIDLNVLVATTAAVREAGGFAEDLRRAVDYDLVLGLSRRHAPALLPFVGAVYADDADDATRISVAEPLAWDYVVRSRHAVDWDGAAAAPRVPGRLSVIVPVRDDVHAARDCVDALLVAGEGVDLEVLVVDLASTRASSLALASLDLADPRIRVHRLPVDPGPVLGTNLALPHTTGEFVAVCAPDVRPAPGWAAPLLSRLSDRAVAAVQPLVVDPDGAVAGAGATFTAAPGQPVPFLLGHPVEDAVPLGDAVLPALWGPLWVARARDLIRVRGLDPLVGRRWAATDVALRLRDAGRSVLVTGVLVTGVLGRMASGGTASGGTASGGTASGGTALEPAGDVDAVMRARWAGSGAGSGRELWRRAGFAVTGHRMDAARPDDPGRPELMAVALRAAGGRLTDLATPAAGAGVPLTALRWRVRASVALAYRAQALASALRRCGEDAVVDLTGRTAARSELDDVTIVLGGPGERPAPPDGTVPAVLWLVDGADGAALRGPDGGIPGFARVLTDRPGPAGPALAPATDPGRFQPMPKPLQAGATVVAGDFARVPPLVRAAVYAVARQGLPLDVHGAGWQVLAPAGVLGSAVSAPDQQAHAYATAASVIVASDGSGTVLPWAALDVASCGTPVFLAVPEVGRPGPEPSVAELGAAGQREPGPTLEVGGAAEVGASPAWSLVRTFSTPEQLLDLLARPVAELFGDEDARLKVARAVALSDSYDARAQHLVGLAQDLLRATA